MLCLCKSRKVMSTTAGLARKQQWIFRHHMSRIYIFVHFSHGVLGHNGFLYLHETREWLYGFEKCKMNVSIDIKMSHEWVKFQFWLNYYPSEGTEPQLSSLKKYKLHILKGISRCSSKFWAQKINPFFIHLLVYLLNDSLTSGGVISISLLTGALFLRSNFPLL